MTDKEIRDRFTYHTPSQEGIYRHAGLSDAMMSAASAVELICPSGREKSLAMTNLEQAKFWASAAVARNPETR